MDPSPSPAGLQDVIRNDALHTRPSRAPDFKAESAALLALTAGIAAEPERSLQRLADAALALTGAHSSGISVEDVNGEDEVFRWCAVAGDFERYLGQTMPRRFSPCGVVLDSDRTLLMQDPVRHFPYIEMLHRPLVEVLLAPFHRDGVPVGTVWVVSHERDKRFDAEDVRLVESLCSFAASADEVLYRLSFGKAT